MRSRGARILAIIWVLLWLGVIVPGHVRGAIPLPGTADPNGPSCGDRSCCVGKRGTPPGRTPSPSNCAVCELVATLSTPPAMITPPPLVLRAGCVAPEQRESMIAIDPPRIGRGRAPPVV